MTRKTGLKHDARELQRITGRSYQSCHNQLRALSGEQRRQLLERAIGQLAEGMCRRIRGDER